MKAILSGIALAALVAAPALASDLLPSPSAQEKRELKIGIRPGATRSEAREALRKQGVPEEMIEKILDQLVAKGVVKEDSSAGSSAPASAGVSGPSASGSGAAVGPTGNGKIETTAAPAAMKADHLNAQALESKDPAIAAIRKEIEAIKQQKAIIEAELALADSKRRAELAPLADERAKLEADRSTRAARIAAQNAAGDAEKARIEKSIAAQNAKISRELNEKTLRIAALEAEARLLRAKSEAEAFAPAAAAAIRAANEAAERVAAEAPVYLDNPLKDGTLYISDRRIPFNGVVCDRLADFVEKRIDFFNNKDPKKPIFIVIDNSPGGSVFSGIRILKAMQSSRAPVFVVVKQFCASMAAITTTSATRSFVYPNTMILHHQMSTGFQGTMTDLRQRQQFTEELYESVFRPIYTKVLNPETNRPYASSAEFEKDMYKHFKSGDWVLFGDKAVQAKWATDTIDRIVETDIRDFVTAPAGGGVPTFARGCVEKRDENGRIYYQLPPLSGPGDAWVIHDPENRFKAN